jgi:hypothetical protein
MSMYVTVLRVSPAAFDAIRRDPSKLDGVLFDESEVLMKRLGITEHDSASFDYRSAAEMMDALEEIEEAEAATRAQEADAEDAEDAEGADEGEDGEEEEDDDEAAEAAEDEEEEEGEDAVAKDLYADGTLDYDAGYGPAFTLSPAAVEKAAKESSVLALDEDVKALFQAAAQRGDYIIGVVS